MFNLIIVAHVLGMVKTPPHHDSGPALGKREQKIAC